MKQIFQDLKTGRIEFADLPRPFPQKGHLLIRTTKTLISLGTEKQILEFGKSNLIQKILKQPERAKQALEKMATDGIAATLNAVSAKLSQPIPIGYCQVGVVEETGEGVTDFKKGDRVVSNGNHAEMVCVPENLCARIPDSVTDETAVFTVVSSIALHGIRLINPTLGESVAVIGLGLIGQLACQILKANGCRVLGFDLSEGKVELAKRLGIEAVCSDGEKDPVAAALGFSNGQGVDAVLITASTKSNAPVEQAPKMCRKRGRVVLIGTVDLHLAREDFYKKEISFQVSCSYGPGRYDANFEKKGMDYPIGYVRWTEQRNFEAVLGLMEQNKILTSPLVSRVIPFTDAIKAYDLLESQKDILGMIFDYPSSSHVDKRTELPFPSWPQRRQQGNVILGFIGAGNFANAVLIPAFRRTGCRLKTISSSGGVSGYHAGKKFGFEIHATDPQNILQDPDINTVVITTPHQSHAHFVVEALKAEKNIFVEKPLSMTLGGLKEIIANLHGQALMVGYNRRFSPCGQFLKKALAGRQNPLCASIMVNAGRVPMDHWTQDPEIGGGRIIGEVCHFIDFLMFLTGARISSVQAATTRGHTETDKDKLAVILQFEDGSLGTIHYYANGRKIYPKERMEVFSDGRVLVLDNFKTVTVYGRIKKVFGSWRQDKGHQECVNAFIRGLRNGQEVIPFEEIVGSTLATFAVQEAIQSQKTVRLTEWNQKILAGEKQ